jgi:hypothetical protein
MPKARVLFMTSPDRGPEVDLASVLLAGPKFDDDVADVFAEIEVERKSDFGREVDLETPA